MNKLIFLALIVTVVTAQTWSLSGGVTSILDGIHKKVNQIAKDFVNDPCVKKVTVDVELGSLSCAYYFNENHKILDAFNCAMNLATKAKDRLEKECNITSLVWNS